MTDAKNVRVTVELTLDELAYISLAFDHMWEFGDKGRNGTKESHWGRLQMKWNEMYRAAHKLRGLGLTSISNWP